MKKYSVWDVLAWICVAGIFLWLILKVAGVINTPVLLEYAPYFGVAYLLGWNVHKLDNLSDKANGLDKFRDETIKEINSIKLNCVRNHN